MCSCGALAIWIAQTKSGKLSPNPLFCPSWLPTLPASTTLSRFSAGSRLSLLPLPQRGGRWPGGCAAGAAGSAPLLPGGRGRMAPPPPLPPEEASAAPGRPFLSRLPPPLVCTPVPLCWPDGRANGAPDRRGGHGAGAAAHAALRLGAPRLPAPAARRRRPCR